MALPNPVDVMSPAFKAGLDLLLSSDRDGVAAVLGRADERIFEEDLFGRADLEQEGAFEGLTPPSPLVDATVQTAENANASVERMD